MKASRYEMEPMGQLACQSPSMSSSISACLSYIEPSNVTPVCYAYEPPLGMPWESARYKSVLVDIVDERSAPGRTSLDAEGFELWNAPTELTAFHDRDEVRAIYYRECLELALRATGGSRAFVFDHLEAPRVSRRPVGLSQTVAA